MSEPKSKLTARIALGAGALAVVGVAAWWFTRAPDQPARPAAPSTVPTPQTPAGPQTPSAPMAYDNRTPQAEVALNLPASVKDQPDLHARLYAEGVKELRAFSESEGAVEEHDEAAPGAPAFSRRIDWTTAADTSKLLSLKKVTAEFAGGAHPNTTLGALLWDKAMKKALTPQDLFRKGADFERLDKDLCEAIIAAKKARLKGDYSAPGDLWHCPKWIESAFVLAPSTTPGKAGGLIFLYPPYAIGAYAEGPYEIVVPLNVFAGALSSAYADDFAGAPKAVAARP